MDDQVRNLRVFAGGADAFYREAGPRARRSYYYLTAIPAHRNTWSPTVLPRRSYGDHNSTTCLNNPPALTFVICPKHLCTSWMEVTGCLKRTSTRLCQS